MMVQGEGFEAVYTFEPLFWGGNAQLRTARQADPGGPFYRIEIIERGEDVGSFDYFTDEQMQELFLAYIALKEARENADSTG